MSKLGRTIEKIAYSRFIPNSIFTKYFSIKNGRNKNLLLSKLGPDQNILALMNEKSQQYWLPRIREIKVSIDNAAIPRDSNAGRIVNGNLIMHNGIKVEPLSYYNYGMLKLLKDNTGVHEPQEEKIFQEVLNTLPSDKKLTMLELGAYWSFYSMWFLREHPTARCVMVEPDRMNLYYGKANFKLNNMTGTFVQAGIGKEIEMDSPNLTVDQICEQQGLEFLDILHSDIQGFEVEMLEGAKKLLSEKRVGYVFISTHSNELHEQCYEVLKRYGFEMVASANLDESYSWDGVLVMKMPTYPGIEHVEISKRVVNS